MGKLEHDLKDVQLPAWALFKNIRFEQDASSPHPKGDNAQIVDYEWLQTANTFDELNNLIPTLIT